MAKFTEGELKVMRILWKHGELKPADIQAHHPDDIKNPALRSYLTILLEKGHVTRRLEGKAYYYQAKTPKESVARRMCRELVERFFNGSTEALVAHLIKTENYSEEDLLQLQRAARGKSADEKTQREEEGKS